MEVLILGRAYDQSFRIRAEIGPCLLTAVVVDTVRRPASRRGMGNDLGIAAFPEGLYLVRHVLKLFLGQRFPGEVEDDVHLIGREGNGQVGRTVNIDLAETVGALTGCLLKFFYCIYEIAIQRLIGYIDYIPAHDISHKGLLISCPCSAVRGLLCSGPPSVRRCRSRVLRVL